MTAVHDFLQGCQVADVLAPFSLYSALPRPSAAALMECFGRMSVARARLQPAESAVIEALRLTAILEPGWWADLVASLGRSALPESVAAEITAICARLTVLEDLLPAINGLLQESAEAGMVQESAPPLAQTPAPPSAQPPAQSPAQPLGQTPAQPPMRMPQAEAPANSVLAGEHVAALADIILEERLQLGPALRAEPKTAARPPAKTAETVADGKPALR